MEINPVEHLVQTVSKAILDYVIDQHSTPDEFKGWLGQDIVRLAFENAVANTFIDVAQVYPQWTKYFFDETLLTHVTVLTELSHLLTGIHPTNPQSITTVCIKSFKIAFVDFSSKLEEELTRLAIDFVTWLEKELKSQEILRPIFEKWSFIAIDNMFNIGTKVDKLSYIVEQTYVKLETALQKSAIQALGNVEDSILITGSYNIIYQTVSQSHPTLLNYVSRFNTVIEDAIEYSTRWFVGRDFIFNVVDDFIQHNPSGYVRISADAGLGKTAIAAQLVKRYKANAHFFNSSIGITRSDDCLNHLCVQLIVRYGLQYSSLPGHAGGNAAFLLEILREAVRKLNDGQQILIVIDALDEAEFDLPGHNWIHLPSQLPRGVYIILTQRPGNYPLQATPQTPVKDLNILWDDPHQQQDIHTYLYQQAQHSEINDVLNTTIPLISAEKFVAELAVASQGNFMYLSYILADISDRESAINPLDLENLPFGLREYYNQFWKHIEQVKNEGSNSWDDWQKLYRPVIAFLGIAGEPVTVEWLAHLIRRDHDEIKERALLRWQRFLSIDRRGGSELWRIVHRSFADFLSDKVNLSETHRYTANYYLGHPSHWIECDKYALRHLSLHLAQAKMFNELGGLIESDTWIKAQRDYDLSLHGYTLDIERGLSVAESAGIEKISKVIAWSLLYSIIRSRAIRIPLDAIEVMVMLGDIQQARHYVELIPAFNDRVSYYCHLALYLNKYDQDEV